MWQTKIFQDASQFSLSETLKASDLSDLIKACQEPSAVCEESRAGIKPISLLFILPAHKTSTSRRGHLWDQYAWCQIQQQTQSWSEAGNWSVSLMPGWSLGDDDDHDFDDRDDRNVDVDCQYIGDSPKCGSYITLSSSGRWKYWCHPGLHKLWTVLLSWADRGSYAPKCVS